LAAAREVTAFTTGAAAYERSWLAAEFYSERLLLHAARRWESHRLGALSGLPAPLRGGLDDRRSLETG
jgi:hypothetical protein